MALVLKSGGPEKVAHVFFKPIMHLAIAKPITFRHSGENHFSLKLAVTDFKMFRHSVCLN